MRIRKQYEAKKERDARRAEEHKPIPWWWWGQRDPIVRFTKWLVFWTALLFIGTIVSAAILLKTDDTLHDQLTLTYPPQIRITNVILWDRGASENDPPTMKPGEEISGVAYAINYGRERATIKASLIKPDWKDNLPMLRPYSGKPPRPDQELFDETGDIVKALAPGEFGQWSFHTTVPPDYDGKKSLYVIGFVIFYDRLNTHHAVLFARKYDPTTQTFSKVENSDYEGDE